MGDFRSGCGAGASFHTIETQTARDISEVSFFANEAESLLLPGTELEVLSCERRWPVGEEGALWMRQHEVRKMDESKNMTHSSERGPLCGPHAAAISAVLSEISIAADGSVWSGKIQPESG